MGGLRLLIAAAVKAQPVPAEKQRFRHRDDPHGARMASVCRWRRRASVLAMEGSFTAGALQTAVPTA
jgi:hypothetical protein